MKQDKPKLATRQSSQKTLELINKIIPNKVMDVQWEDFDIYSFKTIITIYKDDDNFLNYIKNDK